MDAGALGGIERCAVARSPTAIDLVLCAWADHGSLGVATFSGGSLERSAADPADPARSDRQPAVEVRGGAYRGTYSWPVSFWISGITSSVSARSAVRSSGRPAISIGLPNLHRHLAPAAARGSGWPIGCTFSVPIMPTGMIGTPAASASRAAPVRPR